MYKDFSAITNPDLRPSVERLAAMQSPEIDGYIKRYHEQPAEVPADARSLLEHHEWATAARAICLRAPTDNPDIWRNALPPDRVPIIQDFAKAERTQHGYRFSSSAAADYNHENEYRYVGRDEKGNYEFVNAVTRSHKTDAKDVTVGYELLVLSPTGEAATLYLRNDGKTPGLPKEFREVRLLKDLKATYTDVLGDIDRALHAAPGDVKLEEHKRNYQGHLAKLAAGPKQ